MFPDAMQDNYVKSICSKKSNKTNSSNHNRPNEQMHQERSVYNSIPPYVSTMKYSSESRPNGVCPDDAYFQHRPNKTLPGVSSHLRSTNSEPPIPSSHMYAVDRSDPIVNSEPLKNWYSRHDNSQGSNQQFHHNDIILQKIHQNNEMNDSSVRTIKQQARHCKSDNRPITNFNQHLHYESQSQSEPPTPRTQHCSARTAQSFQSHLNHGLRNKCLSSFDDGSTIPSQETIENNMPINEGISVPNSIKVTGDLNSSCRSRSLLYQKSQLPPSDRAKDYTSMSMRSTQKLNRYTSNSSLSYSSPNKMNVGSNNTPTKKQMMDMNIPSFQVIGSSQGTETTATCTSIGSTSFSESDKYLHKRSPDYDSTNLHQQQINPISTQSLPCQPQYSTSIKTPTSSNTSISRSEFRGSNQIRLQILQEIGMAMEMRQKAKLSQETRDYTFWMNHIGILNKELEKIKFENTQHSDASDNTISKELNLYRDELTSEPISKEIKCPSKNKPVSILRNGKNKTRTIKIRAPTDLSAGHIFTVNVKGEEIMATVVSAILVEYLPFILTTFSELFLHLSHQPSGGVSKGEIFPITVPKKGTSTSSSSHPRQHEKQIKVRAPTDLEEGFIFTVKVKGGTITAPIPKGGVKEGEVFVIPT